MQSGSPSMLVCRVFFINAPLPALSFFPEFFRENVPETFGNLAVYRLKLPGRCAQHTSRMIQV